MSRTVTNTRPLTVLAVLALVAAILTGTGAPAAAQEGDGGLGGQQIFADLTISGFQFWGFDGDYAVEVSDPNGWYADNYELWGWPETGTWSQEFFMDGGGFEIQPEELGFPLLPGMVVAVGEKVLVTPDGLTIDTFDTVDGLLSGTAPINSLPLQIVLGGNGCSGSAPVDESGRWSFDVGESCPAGFVFDANTWADARLPDEDGDQAIVWWEPPRFNVSLDGPVRSDDHIEGSGWPLGTVLRILVEDGNDVVFDALTTVDGLHHYNGGDEDGVEDVFVGGSSFSYYEFDEVLGEEFRFEPGMVVTIGPADPNEVGPAFDPESSYPRKDLTIASVLPLGVNFADDTVFGSADPGADVVVYGCLAEGPWGGANSRRVTADGGGNWVADFSIAGEGRLDLTEYGPQPPCELSGYDFGVAQIDADLDETTRQFLIPAINASLSGDERIEVGRVNTDPKLIEILSGPEGGVLWSEEMSPYRGDGEATFEIVYDTHGIDLQPGMVVRVSNDGFPMGEVILADLTMEMNRDTNEIWGTAPGAESIRIDVGNEEGWCSGELIVVAGEWSTTWADLFTETEEGPTSCAGFDVTIETFAYVSVEDQNDLGLGYNGEGDRTSLEWEAPPLWSTEQIAEFVEFLTGEADGKDAKTFTKALKQINESLDSEYWLDYRTLDFKDGYEVFERHAQAAKELKKITSFTLMDENEEGELEEIEIPGIELAYALVFAIDRPLVDAAIEQAASADGNAKQLTKAEAAVDRAEVALEQGDPSAAIKHLGEAWKHAQQAMR